jgi:broad specificity phosphatase PhoE
MLPRIARLARRLSAASLCWLPLAAGADEVLWQRLTDGGQVVLMRHATTTPGIGDPPGFRLADCATQRNLSAAGRTEAQRIGTELRRRNVPVGALRSSRWCRCLDSARLAFGREPEPWPALDSLYEYPARAADQTAALRRVVSEPPARGNLFLVTHQANVRALTGLALGPGEMIVLTPRGDDRFDVAGRLSPVAAPPVP